jgi:hypothetical protein
MPIVNQPAGEDFLIASVMDDPAKEDLDATARPIRTGAVARARVAMAMVEPTAALEAYLLREMLVGGAVAVELFNAWRVNGRRAEERNFASLDGAMRETPAFVAAATRFEGFVRENLRAQRRAGTIDYRDLVTGNGPNRGGVGDSPRQERGRATGRTLPSCPPPDVDLDLRQDRAAKICIGSMQGIRIWVRSFRATDSPPAYTATLKYEIRDHFGVDDDDCEVSRHGLHGTPGQVGMWVLQHHRRPGHMPWITVVRVERQVQGSLA